MPVSSTESPPTVPVVPTPAPPAAPAEAKRSKRRRRRRRSKPAPAHPGPAPPKVNATADADTQTDPLLFDWCPCEQTKVRDLVNGLVDEVIKAHGGPLPDERYQKIIAMGLAILKASVQQLKIPPGFDYQDDCDCEKDQNTDTDEELQHQVDVVGTPKTPAT